MNAHPLSRRGAYVTKTRQHRGEHARALRAAAHAQPGPGGALLTVAGVRGPCSTRLRALAARMRFLAPHGAALRIQGPTVDQGLTARNDAVRGGALPRWVCRDAARVPGDLDHTQQRRRACQRRVRRWRLPHVGVPRVSARTGLLRVPSAQVKAQPRRPTRPAAAAAAARVRGRRSWPAGRAEGVRAGPPGSTTDPYSLRISTPQKLYVYLTPNRPLLPARRSNQTGMPHTHVQASGPCLRHRSTSSRGKRLVY